VTGPGPARPPARPQRRHPSPSFWKAGRPSRRLLSLAAVTVILFAAAVVRVGVLQTVDAKGYESYGQRQRTSTLPLPADRGVIFDRNGQELALSVPKTTIWADPRSWDGDPGEPTTQQVVAQLAGALGLDQQDADDLGRRIAPRNAANGRPVEFAYVARQVDDDVAAKVEALHIKGISTMIEPKRILPNGDLAVGLLGASQPEGDGSAGLELQFNDLLKGTPGEIVRERGSGGRTIPNGRKTVVDPKPGDDLVLTIDKALQWTTEEALKKQVAATHAKGGMVVIMDTHTGDILAMANVRADPQTGAPQVSKANMAVIDTYEPGSVAKIITASAVISEGKMAPGVRIDVPYQKQFFDHVFADAEPHGLEHYDIEDIIAHSSNIGTMELSRMIGTAKQEEYMHLFGLGERSPLDFPGESKGLLKPSAQWRGTEKVTVSYGQGVAVTAMQLAAAMNVIANGGTYVAPRLVAATIDAQGQRHDAPASATHTVLTSQVANQMNGILRAVICRGTGRRAAIDGYAVAGKTGTAYKAQSNGTYLDANGNKHYYASFSGFVPADNPQLTVLVSIDEPEGAHYGGLVAAPLFVSVAQEALRQQAVPPSPGGGGCPAVDKGGE
jgi:cell division protein FtsI (penicillin-binding protein 3)